MLDQLVALSRYADQDIPRHIYEPLFGRIRSLRATHGELSSNPELSDGVMRVYARRATSHFINGDAVVTLDIARVHVQRRLRGRGRFTALLSGLVEHAQADAVYVENVHNERLAAHLHRDGWHIHQPGHVPPSFWRWTAHRDAAMAP
jgi:GNAT superfamily N-acetyltransferase